jgi:hypothetical protein
MLPNAKWNLLNLVINIHALILICGVLFLGTHIKE